MKRLFSLIYLAACCGVLASATTAFAQGTAFTYQGRLNSNGSPVTGQYDLKFALYTTSSGGSAAFGPITNSAVAVSNGLFVAALDFGGGVFNGTTYWLDISARTNGTGTFIDLAPRQQLTPSPYAVYAPNAGVAASAGSVAAANITGTISVGQLSSAVVTNGEGNVTLNGSFSGNGANITNIPLSGLASAGSLTLTSNGLDFILTATLSVGLEPVFVTGATNLNGAGHVDLAVANILSNSISVLTNDGRGGFFTDATLNVATNPFWIAVSDVNGDGRPDLICSYYVPNGPPASIITVLTNAGNGRFGSNATLTVGLNPTCVLAADVNGDGKPDLITANYGTNNLTILTNNGSGGFVYSATLKVGTNPVEVVAADIIGNGRSDLICANLGTNTLSVLINNGNGTFLPTTYTVGNQPRSVLAFDANGDGLVDLVCNNNDGTLSVLTNNGDGTFTTAYTSATNFPSVNNIAAADVNGDGKLDVIGASSSQGLLVVLNTGNGTFGEPISLVPNIPGAQYYSVAAVDVNGDGKPDLMAVDLTSNLLVELINVDGQQSAELTLADQSGGLKLMAGLNGVPDMIGGSSANVVDPGLDGSIIASGGTAANPNHISSSQSAISGGEGNTIQALADHSSIGGGFGNTIQTNASYAVIGGGYSNTAGGFCATVPGGFSNLAIGPYSLAAGRAAQATNSGSFVWADSSGTPFPSTGNDQFNVRAGGGVRLVNGAGTVAVLNDSTVPGITVSGGSGTGHLRFRNGFEVWPNTGATAGGYLDVRSTNGAVNIILDGDSGNITNTGNVYAHGVQLTSDRNAKENFTAVSSLSVLAKVAALPLTEWNYKGDAADIRHMGPMAQDFFAAFSLNGEDNRHISAGDEGGVALAAIQGLNQKLEQQVKEVKEKEKEIRDLKQRLERLERTLVEARNSSSK
ncbi:MAG TPA: FG-GAP-like repeat-containing protein [Candidatus Binatia bacterium]|jgi:hypothetical protein|nr:FG-GAP-like repeat-containing protein [Candidatus Binatia bacterium]